MVSGIFFLFVSGRKNAKAPAMKAERPKVMSGAWGLYVAKSATQVDAMAPNLEMEKNYILIQINKTR